MDEFSITEHFVQDHKKHAELIAQFQSAMESDGGDCNDCFNNLRNALIRHFQEEEDLFKTYEDRSEDLDVLMKTIREQHRRM